MNAKTIISVGSQIACIVPIIRKFVLDYIVKMKDIVLDGVKYMMISLSSTKTKKVFAKHLIKLPKQSIMMMMLSVLKFYKTQHH